jgi:tetratricopeptide (TPR) repeat protein
MRRLICALLVVAAIPASAAAGGTATGLHAEPFEASLDRRVHDAMQAVFRSRLSEAERIAAELVNEAPEDPRAHLLAARVLRETFPDQNASKARLDRTAAPIHAALERAVAAADHMIELDAHSLPGHLYRGWAHMFGAQMSTLCGEYWRAGRQAKAGKKDLDRALAADPANADAAGVLGTYLYFADALPAVVKFARTLVRVPGGDRDRGLELLRAAARSDGYNRLDARALVAVIEFAFEGDFHDAEREFDAMLRDYPGNPRLLEPLAVLHLISPRRDGGARVAEAAARHSESTEPWNRQMSQRLRFYDALATLLDSRFDAAQASLEAVRRAAPPQPDWFAPDVMLCAGELALLLGERQPALAVYATAAQAGSVPDDAHDTDYRRMVEERLRFLRDPEAVAPPAEVAALRALEPIAAALAAGDLDRARDALNGSDSGPGASFYRAEWARLSARYDDAAAAYAQLTEVPLPARWRFFKVIAFARRAEVLAARGDRRAAARTLEHALEYNADRDLLRHALRARRRWYESDGDRNHDPADVPPAASR